MKYSSLDDITPAQLRAIITCLKWCTRPDAECPTERQRELADRFARAAENLAEGDGYELFPFPERRAA